MNERGVSVIQADAPLLALVNAVKLLTQGFVGAVVEVDAPYAVMAVFGMGVEHPNHPHALADDDGVRRSNLVLPFVSPTHSSPFVPQND